MFLRRYFEAYHDIVIAPRDPRTQQWPLMSSPFIPVAIVALYVWFVKYKGPQLMENRKPFDLKWVLIIFNAIQVAINLYIFILGITLAYGFGPYSYRCQPVDYSWSNTAITVAFGSYLYYIVKIVDLLDTIFYVLRKRDRQISFLHVYHHGGMVIIVYAGICYFPGGNSVFLGALNTFVHVVMYSYYLVTAWNPNYKNRLWWKKHLTQMQMIQFLMIIIHTSQLIWEDCGYPRWTIFILLPQNIFMLALFWDFYRSNYLGKRRSSSKDGTQEIEEEKKSQNNNACAVQSKSTKQE